MSLLTLVGFGFSVLCTSWRAFGYLVSLTFLITFFFGWLACIFETLCLSISAFDFMSTPCALRRRISAFKRSICCYLSYYSFLRSSLVGARMSEPELESEELLPDEEAESEEETLAGRGDS